MGDVNLMQIGMMLVAALSVGALAWVVTWPFLSGEKRNDQRLASVTTNRNIRLSNRAETETAQNRHKEVSEKLKEIEDRQKAKEKVTLRLRFERAGLSITPSFFWLLSIGAGAFVGLLVLVSFPGVHFLASVLAAFAGAFGLPRFILNFLIKRRQKKFIAEFANSIDVIVRGVKSGLPLGECLAIIAREAPQPIAGEFQDLVDQQRVGVPLSEAFDRMMKRMPLHEVKFFSIVIGIQSQSGGNLSEALGNLSGVLRARKGMAAKVAALSSEAKASAGILASLPFAVTILVYLSTPEYIALLWTTMPGQVLLIIGLIWMSLGMLVMRKMINFKY